MHVNTNSKGNKQGNKGKEKCILLRLKIRDSHLTCKVANKCLNVRERVEMVE